MFEGKRKDVSKTAFSIVQKAAGVMVNQRLGRRTSHGKWRFGGRKRVWSMKQERLTPATQQALKIFLRSRLDADFNDKFIG